MITWIIKSELAKSARPGYPSKNVSPTAVKKWFAQLKKAGIKSIICLLNEDEMFDSYERLPNGLLGAYGEGSIPCNNIAVDNYKDPMPPQCRRIWKAFQTREKPVLVHCVNGKRRAQIAVRHILVMREVDRIISNRFQEDHPFKDNSAGLQDFALLAWHTDEIPEEDLGELQTKFDELLLRQKSCQSCACKLCALLEQFYKGRLPDVEKKYAALYQSHYAARRTKRDFRAEVNEAIEKAFGTFDFPVSSQVRAWLRKKYLKAGFEDQDD